MTFSSPILKIDLANMADADLAAYAEQQGEAAHAANQAYTAAVEIQLARALRALYPEGQIVKFDVSEYENGCFLGVGKVLDASGEDIRDTFDDAEREREHPGLEVLLGEITHCWGAGYANADEAFDIVKAERLLS